jgi:site-specific DNA-methyltransferase (adenine-specific)
MKITDKITVTNEDNLTLMARYPDKYFELAIVDPPYGIGADENAFKNGVNCKANGFKEHKKSNWDNAIPTKEYFDELKRVSKNQIIWGGNYFTEHLPPVMSWIIWDKMQYNFSFSHGEMAWNSFNTKLLIFKYARGNESGFAPKIPSGMKQGLNIHPTQKPIALYKYCLENFANEGDKILDTHFGSGSIAIACHDYGFDLTACELDPEYFEKSVKRLKNHVAQQKLF